MIRCALVLALMCFTCPSSAVAEEATQVRQADIPIVYQAVGTVRPLLEAKVMAQAAGRILTVAAKEGAQVARGDELASIEDRELTLRLSQARRGVEEAEARRMQAQSGKVSAMAVLAQARSEFERVKKFFSQKASTKQQLEQAEAVFGQARAAVDGAGRAIEAAEAAVKRAGDGVEEAQVALGYAKVVAPFSGVLVRRLVEPGDLAWPGRPLFELMDRSTMRLEAHVREGLAGSFSPGHYLHVFIDALDKRVQGLVDEVSPAADPSSRTFVVKVRLPEGGRLLPGMFGRLHIRTGTRLACLIPYAAVRQVGQLQTVRLKKDGAWILRLVRMGERIDDYVEILSGLTPGDVVALSSRESTR